MTEDLKTQSLIEDFEIPEDPEVLTDHYNQLTEDLQKVLDKRETVKSLIEVIETMTQTREYISGLDRQFSDLEDLKTFYTDRLTEDLEDLERESDRLLYSLQIISETPILVFLGLTPIMIEEYYDLEERPEIGQLLTAGLRLQKTEDLTQSLTEDLTDLRERVRSISLTVSKSRDKIEKTAVYSGIVTKIDGSDHGLDLSEIGRLDLRLSQTLCLLSETISDLESISESLSQVSESLSLFREDISIRQKRLTLRYHLTKDRKTGEIVSESLREKVSKSLLDSGGYPKYDPETGQYIGSSQGYGRHFERNTLRDFESESPVSFDLSFGLEVSISLFHFLTDCLDYDPILDSLFVEYSQTPDLDSESWLYCQSDFMDSLGSLFEISGLYGESDPFSDNTYNTENLLDQDFLYHYFTIDQTPRVSISIHNGCNIRGGYTRPTIYMTSDHYDETKILCQSDLYISIEDPETGERSGLYTDDSYHLYTDSDQVFDQSPYDFRTRSDNLEDRREETTLKEKIERLESIISDLVTYTDPEDPENNKRLFDLLKIRDQTVSDLEVWTEDHKYGGSRSLTFSDFRVIESEDLIDLLEDPEYLSDHYANRDPVIYARRDPESGEIRPYLSGLGYMYFYF